MRLPRIVLLVFAAAAAVAALSDLVSFPGRLADAAGVIALLAAAAFAALTVRGPVVRWALAAGIGALAAVPVMRLVSVDRLPALLRDVGEFQGITRQDADVDYAATLFLVIAAAALTVAAAALPRLRRPAWPTALAGVVALVTVGMVVADVSGPAPYPAGAVPPVPWWHLAPGLAATVLAGLAFVLAVPRADGWFLLPAGALLVQVAAALRTGDSADSWTTARLSAGIDADAITMFLHPGLRTEVPPAPWVLDVEVGAALAAAAFLLGPMLIALGAAAVTADDSAEPRA